MAARQLECLSAALANGLETPRWKSSSSACTASVFLIHIWDEQLKGQKKTANIDAPVTRHRWQFLFDRMLDSQIRQLSVLYASCPSNQVLIHQGWRTEEQTHI